MEAGRRAPIARNRPAPCNATRITVHTCRRRDERGHVPTAAAAGPYHGFMDIGSALRQLGRDMVRIDRSAIDAMRAARNTVGIVTPLALGAMTGHLLTGFGAGIGALTVAFTDMGGPYRLRAFRMVMASLFGGVSAFAGSTSGSVEPIAVILVALWGFGGGMLMALGPAAGQVGVTGIILLLLYGGYPTSPGHAVTQGLLVLAGGLFQTLLAVGAWPARQYGPERAVLATVFGNLADAAREPADPNAAPPMTGAISTASTTLGGFGRDGSNAGDAFRVLLDEAERIRMELVSLNAIPDSSADLTAMRADVAQVLESVRAVLLGDKPTTAGMAALPRIDAAIHRMRAANAKQTEPARLSWERSLAHLDALAGELRAVVELAAEGSGSERVSSAPTAAYLGVTVRGSLEILRANLTMRATSFRHALRLAVCLLVASFLARRLGVSRVYWVPLTAAIVLRPDFAATFTRGVGRIVGTMLGLAVATGLVFTPFWNLPGRIVLIGIFAFAVRSLGPANFSIAAVGVTALVVVLLSFAGAPPDTTVGVRALDTLLGGGVALAIYLLWPTWERSQTPIIVADMLDTYRAYFKAVMDSYLNPPTVDAGRLASARLASRLARSNAETSIERLRTEPVARGERLDRIDGLLASSHRFAQSALTLESGLYREPRPALPPSAERFARHVERTIEAMARRVRDPSSRLDELPDLRADQNELVRETSAAESSISPYEAGTLAAETDRMTNSLNTIAHLLREGDRHP